MQAPNARLEQFHEYYKTASQQALQLHEQQFEAFKKQMTESFDFLKSEMEKFEYVIKAEK